MGLKKFINTREGGFFSTDALLAMIIIFLFLLIVFPLNRGTRQETEVHRDILNSLSSLKVGEADNAYVQSLISSGEVSDPDKSLFEQIGEFYATNATKARLLASAVLSELNFSENVGIWYGSSLIFSKNSTPYEGASDVDTARQFLSGIQNSTSATGFSARAFLLSGKISTYVYFGGYVGDGNLSILATYSGNVSEATMELAINKDFELFINNIPQGNFPASPSEFTPQNYTLSTVNFASGNNLIEFKGDNLHIAGGFVKIVHTGTAEFQQTERYNFPGVEGLINVYDGFYVPGDLSTMEIFIHFNNTVLPAFLNIGNVTVFNGITNEEETITLTNSELDAMLDYDEISMTTVPLRFGLENVTFSVNATLDLISVPDMSKFMRCSNFDAGVNQNQCASAGAVWMLPANQSKEANTLLVNEILALPTGKVGIVGMDASQTPPLFHELSSDDVSLLNLIDELEEESNYNANNLRLCSGVLNSIDEFLERSDDDAIRVMIVLLAGQVSNPPCNLATEDLNFDLVIDSKDDAIQAACDAYNNHNIEVYTVAYGDAVDSNTLQQMAVCGNGAFFSQPNATELISTYEQIVDDIFAEYLEQTVISSEGILTRLYADSYIEFDFNRTALPFGLVITAEESFDNTTSGDFSVPSDVDVASTRVTSYSGQKWTKDVFANNISIYNLSSYGEDYISLGDPFNVRVPNSFVNVGATNEVSLATGSSPENSSAGSQSNKIIYTVVRNASAFSPIVSTAEGCNWQIQLEDDSMINVTLPPGYSGPDVCIFSEATGGQIANENDALQVAVLNLLYQLDLNSNGKLDVSFEEGELSISIEEVTGIPFTWSSEVQARRWL